MNRLAFASTLLLPSIALAHPGHDHAGMSSYHHLVIGAVFIAAASIGVYFFQCVQKSRSDKN